MVVGVVREIKEAEGRVALTPAGARELVAHGHDVLLESGAGRRAGFDDEHYIAEGARLTPGADQVWEASDLLLKVKEPIELEYPRLRGGQILFTYLHLAADPRLVEALTAAGSTAVAYETIEDATGRLPLLAPMSEVAGRLAAQTGAYFLQEPMGGPGVLMGGVPGVRPARVLIIGGGVVGTHAARVATGMGADVTILERSLARIRDLEQLFQNRATVLASDALTLEREVEWADLVIGAVLVPGTRAPRLVGRSMLEGMAPGSVVVDVAIDQGGCIETSRPTTHTSPTFVEAGVLHYCVANMPGGVPRTSTQALTNATLPYILRLADDGLERALASDPGLARGLNVHGGRVVFQPVLDALAAPEASPSLRVV